MGGGQVNIVSGEFVFKVQEAFLIENGQSHRAGARRDFDRQWSDDFENH